MEMNLHSSKWARKWTMGSTAMLLSAALILSACGDGGGGGVAPADGDVAPADGGAVATPAVEEEVIDEEALEEEGIEEEITDEEVGEEEAEGSEVIETETGLITETEVLTETEVVTQEEVIEVITETVVTTGAVGTDTTGTEVITETELMTDVEDATGTGDMTETEQMTETEGMTETQGTTEDEATGATSAAAAGATGAAAAAGASGVSGVEDQLVRASTLLDYNFENIDGEVSGDLEDLLIDLNTGQVLFTQVEYGGILDLGDTDIVVPLSAFEIGPEGELVLAIDEQQLQNYPDVGNNWPDLNDPAWDDDVNSFWNEAGIEGGTNFEEATTSVAWASQLIGMQAGNIGTADTPADATAGTVGSISDILVNLGTGQAPYAIVNFGAGLDEDPYVLPLSAFDTTNWSEGLNFQADFTPDMLEGAPRFDQETYAPGTPIDTGFGDTVESWWNDLGFGNE